MLAVMVQNPASSFVMIALVAVLAAGSIAAADGRPNPVLIITDGPGLWRPELPREHGVEEAAPCRTGYRPWDSTGGTRSG